jgi:hypothetical protein
MYEPISKLHSKEDAEKRATKNREYGAIVPSIKSHDFPVINNAQDLCDLLNVLNA